MLPHHQRRVPELLQLAAFAAGGAAAQGRNAAAPAAAYAAATKCAAADANRPRLIIPRLTTTTCSAVLRKLR